MYDLYIVSIFFPLLPPYYTTKVQKAPKISFKKEAFVYHIQYMLCGLQFLGTYCLPLFFVCCFLSCACSQLGIYLATITIFTSNRQKYGFLSCYQQLLPRSK